MHQSLPLGGTIEITLYNTIKDKDRQPLRNIIKFRGLCCSIYRLSDNTGAYCYR